MSIYAQNLEFENRIETKKPLANYKSVTDIELKLTGNWFRPIFIETTPEVGRNKIVAKFKN